VQVSRAATEGALEILCEALRSRKWESCEELSDAVSEAAEEYNADDETRAKLEDVLGIGLRPRVP